MYIDISICPTVGTDTDGNTLRWDDCLAAIRAMVSERYPGARIDIQQGYHQGDDWYKIDGRRSDELEALVVDFDWSDEALWDEREDEDDDE